jgi:hypothetical protein
MEGMIGRVFTGFALAGFAFWTVLCFGVWAVVALGGDLLRWLAGLALDPQAGGIADSALRFLEAFGTALVAWVWLAGSALIAVVGFVMRKAAANATVVRVATFETRGWGPAEMKDVTPPRGAGPDPDAPRLPKP